MRLIQTTGWLALVSSLMACSTNNSPNSSWMTDNHKQLDPQKITQLAIPGSHYSNAYGIDNTRELEICVGETVGDNPSNNAKLANLILQESTPASRQQFMDYLNTQGNNIYAQLNNGIRYLELQICLQNTLYYTSNYYLTDSLELVTQQIKQFIADNPRELIIVDLDDNLRANYGKMSAAEINNLHDYLQSKLGAYLTPSLNGETLTFAQMWQSKHRLILLSSNPDLVKYYDVWNKNTMTLPEQVPHYTTIKKLTGIQQALQQESNNALSKFSIIPIYSWYDAELNNAGQLKSNSNDHLIFEYLYSLPNATPINIIVTDHQFTRPLVEFTLQKNFHVAGQATPDY